MFLESIKLCFLEANIVRPELPEEADRVEQLLCEFRAVQQRIHDLNQEMEARISVAIEAVAADLRNIIKFNLPSSLPRDLNYFPFISPIISLFLAWELFNNVFYRHIYVLTNTGDIMTFDFCQNKAMESEENQ